MIAPYIKRDNVLIPMCAR